MIPVLLLTVFVSGACLLLIRASSDIHAGFQATAAALTCFALLTGGYWYFVERRGIPKVNVEPEVQAWPVADRLLLVRASVSATNVGVTAVRLDKAVPVELELGQVFPPAGKQAAALIADAKDPAKLEAGLALAQTDKWPLRASNYEGVDAVIEAGESEKLYYKAVIPCEDGMVIALTAKVPKQLSWFDSLFEPEREQAYWIAQAVAEMKGRCL